MSDLRIRLGRITHERVLDAAAKVLAVHSEDHVDRQGRYFDFDTETPGCLVGHILAELGLRYSDIAYRNCRPIGTVVNDLDLDISERAMIYLRQAQHFQDLSATWGYATLRAEEATR